MAELAPLVRDQRKVDADHLKLLAIFHFVGAGLALLGLLFLMVHFAFMNYIFTNPKMWQGPRQNPPPPELFAIMKIVYLLFAAWFTASGVLNVLSGLFLRARKHRTFSIIVAAIDCLHVPIGTTLGIFTLIVLMRDSVRELYES